MLAVMRVRVDEFLFCVCCSSSEGQYGSGREGETSRGGDPRTDEVSSLSRIMLCPHCRLCHSPEHQFITSAFIFAGHDTTTSAVCRLLHLLALNQDVQTRLRNEVTEARAQARIRAQVQGNEKPANATDGVLNGLEGELDYDTLMGLPYLDAVVRETLRVYPPVPTVVRT